MTTAGMWWADTLESFSEAFSIRYDLVQENHPSVRETGEWWQRDDNWCVQLDAWAHACWLDGVDDPAWRRLLSVSLQNASGASARQLSWREVITRHFSELVHRALTDTWPLQADSRRLGLRLTTRELKTPGHFSWLEFSHEPADGEDFREMVQQVVEASRDVVFIGWTEHPNRVQAALVFLEESHRQGDDADWDEEDTFPSVQPGAVPGGELEAQGHTPDSPARSRAGMLVANRILSPLLDSLESDAMVPVKATVGGRVTQVHDWASGLHSLAEAWRERVWFAPGQSIYGWGQQPVAYLLASLSKEQMGPFLQMATEGAQGDISLSPDLVETLQGILAANLNISEASRILYLHRNTLMNRIDRIHSQTGYDVRNFEDALLLWVVQVLLRRQKNTSAPENRP